MATGRRAVALTAGSGHHWWHATTRTLLATTLLERGEAEQARRLLVEARVAAERGGVEAYLLRSLAPLAEATGDRAVLAEADALLGGIRAPDGGCLAGRG